MGSNKQYAVLCLLTLKYLLLTTLYLFSMFSSLALSNHQPSKELLTKSNAECRIYLQLRYIHGI